MSTDHDIGYGWSHKQEEGEKEVVRLLYSSRQSGLDNNRYDTGSTEEKEESHHS